MFATGPRTEGTRLDGSVHYSEDSANQEALSDGRTVACQTYGVKSTKTAVRFYHILVILVVVKVSLDIFFVNKVLKLFVLCESFLSSFQSRQVTSISSVLYLYNQENGHEEVDVN